MNTMGALPEITVSFHSLLFPNTTALPETRFRALAGLIFSNWLVKNR
jgi:hypothetical protein